MKWLVRSTRARSYVAALVLVVLIVTAAPVALAADEPPAALPDVGGLFAQLSSLAGVAALIAVLLNGLKSLGIVKDGTAPLWSTGLNLLALIGLFAANVVGYKDIAGLDATAALLAQLGTVALALVTQLGLSKLTHNLLRGVPIVGQSYSVNAG